MNLKEAIEEVESIVEHYAGKEEANGDDELAERAREALGIIKEFIQGTIED